jgi:hypothetical protein
MRHFCTFISSALLAAVAASASGQTVTVAKSGSPDYSTIQAAIDSFTTTDDPNVPNVVQITDGAIYDEIITINVPLTLEGTGGSRPVIAVQGNAAGYDQDGDAPVREWSGDAGLLIHLPPSTTTASLALRNLIIIPSLIGTPPVAGIVNKANNFFLDMENLLVTSNDGSNAPVNTDGMVDVGTVHTSFRVSGAHLGSITNDRPEGAGVEVAMRDCIFTNIKGVVGESWRSGMYMYRTYYVYGSPSPAGIPTRPNAYRKLTIDGKCMFTFNNGTGLRCAASLEILTPEDRCMFVGNQYSGLWQDMTRGLNVANGIITAGNGQMGVNEGVGNSGPRMDLKNAIVANNGWYGTYHRLGNATQAPSQMENVTVANNSKIHASTDQMQASAIGNYIDLETTNSILAGDGNTAKPANRINWISQGSITLVNTAVVTSGPQALSIPAIVVHATNGAVIGEPVTNADPDFVNIIDPFDPDFYAVNNPVYGNLALDGGPLTGGGAYIGAAVKDWSVY